MVTLYLADLILSEGQFRPGLGFLVEGGEILDVGEAPRLEGSADLVRNYRGMAIVPGTVNAHNHSFQSLLRGFGDDLPFFAWRDVLYRLSPSLGPEEVYSGALFAFGEMLKNGITTVTDFFYLHRNSNESAEAVVEAAKRLGIRLVLARAMYDWSGAPKQYQESVDDARRRTVGLMEKYKKKGETVSVQPAPHSPHGASAAMIRAGFEIAEAYDTKFHIHLAEGSYERQMTIRENGLGPLRYLDRLGVLGKRTVAVHCVWLDEGELDLMAERGASLAYNPSSNMFLGDGITKIKEMLERGITIALGTDGGCSNNRVSIFEEMRMASLLQKVRHLDGSALTAAQALAMGTENGGRVLGIPVGVIAPGFKADFVALNLSDLSLHPLQNLESNLVYSFSPTAIAKVVVNGREVCSEGKLLTVDESEIVERVKLVTGPWH